MKLNWKVFWQELKKAFVVSTFFIGWLLGVIYGMSVHPFIGILAFCCGIAILYAALEAS